MVQDDPLEKGGIMRGKQPMTGTLEERVDPRQHQAAPDTVASRILVVCPYPQFNAFFEAELPNYVRGGVVEIVSEAEQPTPPYIDVRKREQGKQEPYWVINFGHILAPVPHPTEWRKMRWSVVAKRIADHVAEIGEKHDLFNLPLSTVLANIGRDMQWHLEHSEEAVRQGWRATDKLVPRVRGIVGFDGYSNWVPARITKLYPQFPDEIAKHHTYDNGVLQVNQVPVEPYMQRMRHDFRRVLEGNKRDLKFFYF